MSRPSNAHTAEGEASAARAELAAPRADLASEVAHAFKTPLAVISGYVELLQLRDDPRLRAEALPRMEAAVARLGLVIDRLLAAVEQGDRALAEQLLDGSGTTQPPSPSPRRRGALSVFGGAQVRRVVIVDDDDEIRQLLLRTLPTDGFELLEARDGLEALELLEREAPDLLVLDWNMPNVTGGEVLAELERQGHRVPVIVLTADANPRRREIAAAQGAAAFLVKPFSPTELIRAIERLLG